MLRSVFGKTLFEKRFAILFWALGLLLANLAIMQLFPPLKEAFAQMTQDLPASLEVWFGGDGQIWTTLRGYVGMEIMGQMTTAMIVLAMVFSLSTLASEESSGVLLTQFSKPISRTSFYLQKFLAFVVATVIVMIGFYLGTWFGSVVLNDIIPLGELFQPIVAITLLTLVFGTLTFALSAASGSKVLAGAVIGCYAIFGYFITSLRGAAEILTTLSKATPFYYYNNPSVIDNGLELKNVLILAATIIIPLVVALLIFARRDLKTR
ncbi:MAG: ABC transporter permease [Candidatus Nomurabacteria bacterium]|jgi:ABC-2 type transport system permease protein|nr:ABC transporter permease [Candidatus Nomurabacteria bacterium]